MGTWAGALLALGALAFGVQPSLVHADGPQAGASWAQLNGDGARTGRAAVNGPASPLVTWRYTTGSAIVSGPVIAADGTIYVGTENFRVWALRPDGTLRWTYELPDGGGGAAPSHLLLNSKGQIVFGTENGYIIGLQTDGKEAWRFDTRNAPYGTADPQAVRGAPAAGANTGRIYVGTDGGLVYELEDGAFVGVRRCEGDGPVRAGAVVTPDGTVVWGTMGRALRAGSFNGDKWRIMLDGAISGTPAAGGDSTVYATTSAGSVFAIATDGQQRWRVTPGAGRALRSGVALGLDGTVYAGGDEGRLYALDPSTGAVRWSFGTLGALTTSPTVGADGTIYLASGDGTLYVLTPDGQLRSKVTLDGGVDGAAPAIGAQGVLYTGTRAGTLYAFKDESGPTAPAASAQTPATPATAVAPETPGGQSQAPAAAPAGFTFVRCGSGRVYTLTADGQIGTYVTRPAALDGQPLFQASETVPQATVDAVCGPGR